jgi:Ca2+-binding RTX toxin-like protein
VATINGTSGNDVLNGTNDVDDITGQGGDDTITAFDGNDTVYGGLGNDSIDGGAGNDRLDGQDGDDVIHGGIGDDTLYGGRGNDIVDGGDGNDTFVVTNDQFAGSDLYSGDQFIGGNGIDNINFNGSFTYGFTAFDITATSISGIEYIHAGLPVRLTFAQLSQFTGFDGIFYLTGSGTLDLTGGSFTSGSIYLGSGNDTVTMAGTTALNARALDGGAGSDHLTGGETPDILVGGDGNDTIDGRGGEDSIDGGAGNDTIHGGDGNDTISDGFGVDYLDGGAGDDIFQLDLEAGFGVGETVIGGTGVDAIWLSGSPYDNEWYAFSSFNISGVERLDAPEINMTMTTAEANAFEYLVLDGLRLTTAGTVTVGGSFSVNQLELSAFGNTVDLTADTGFGARVTGGNGNDTVTGSSSNDVITGGGGNDVIHGGGAHDELTGGNGVDWLDGGSGDDTLFVAAGETISAGDHFTGGSGNDTLMLNNSGVDSPSDLSIAIVDRDIETLYGQYIRLTVAQASSFQNISGNLYLADAGTVDFTGRVFSGNIHLSDFGNTVIASDQVSNTGIYVFGGAGNDSIAGSAVHDELLGGGGNDVLRGGAGDDLLDGGTGADAMDGGAGGDTYVVDNIGDTASEAAGPGYDTVLSSVSFTIGANIEELWLQGTGSINGTGNASDNHIVGTSGNNVLDGRAGADVMQGQDGNDTYIVDNAGDQVEEIGWTGVDLVKSSVTFALPDFVENLTLTGTGEIDGWGNALANVIRGNSADNHLYGAYGNDQLYGGAGDDHLEGNGDNDSLYGQDGNDWLDGGDGADVLNGGFGDDILIGGAGDDVIDSGASGIVGNEIRDGAGNDTVHGGDGIDMIVGSAGNDYYDGGAGLDFLYYNTADILAGIVLDLRLASGQVRSSGTGDSANVGVDTLSNIETIVGSSFDDVMTAAGTAITFYGSDGNDRLTGGSGNDTLDGGDGNDTLSGGGGSDTASYAAASAGVAVSLAIASAQNTGGAGTDTLLSIENLTGSAYSDDLRGNAGANDLSGLAGNDKLTGLAGDDTLDGGAGIDAMRGGLGDDIYYVDNVRDNAIENAGEGTDTVFSSASYSLGSNVENLTITGSAVRGNGNSLANAITGNSGDNILNGGAGADTMTGGLGNDTYYIDNAGDRAIESAGAGRDRVYTTISLTLDSNLDDLFARGSDAINLTGNALDNTLRGNSAANILTGGAGADDLRGGTGADTFVFRDGDFAGLTPSTADRIIDFSHSEGDRIDLAQVDANSGLGGDQDFTFIGSSAFHNVAGELRYEIINGNTYVYGDTNGDGLADLMIRLDGSHALTSGDFIVG